MDGNEIQKNDRRILRDFSILGLSSNSYWNLVQTGMLKEIINRNSSSLLSHLRYVRCTGRSANQKMVFLAMGLYYVECVNSKQREKDFSVYVNKMCSIPTDLYQLMNIIGNKQEIMNDFANFPSLKDLNALMNNNPIQSKERYKFIKKHRFIEKWYLDGEKTAIDLLYLLTKYKQRYGWSHEKIIKKSHFKFPGIGTGENMEGASNGDNRNLNMIINYILHGLQNLNKNPMYKDYFENCDKLEYEGKLPIDEITNTAVAAIHVIEKSKTCPVDQIVKYIERYWRRRKEFKSLYESVQRESSVFAHVPDEEDEEEADFDYGSSKMVMADGSMGDVDMDRRQTIAGYTEEITESKFDRFHFCHEHLPTKYFRNPEVWRALIHDLPITALIRNISHIASLGLLSNDEDENVGILLEAIKDPKRIAKVHPFQILKAILQYKSEGKANNRQKKEKNWAVRDDLYEGLCESFALCLKSNPCTSKDNLDLTSDLRYKICIQASGSMLESGFTGGDSNLCRTGAAIGMAHGIKHFCENSDIFICRREAYGVDQKQSKKDAKKVRTHYLVSEDQRDLYSRVTRVKALGHGEGKEIKVLKQAPTEVTVQEPMQVPIGDIEVPLHPTPPRLPGSGSEKKRNSDLSAPIRESIENSEHIDAFIVFSTCIADELVDPKAPYNEFKRYQEEVNPNAKFILCVMDVLTDTEKMVEAGDPSVILPCGADGYLLREIIQFMHPDRVQQEEQSKQELQQQLEGLSV